MYAHSVQCPPAVALPLGPQCDGVLFPGIAIGKVVLNDNKKLVELFADPDQISVVSVALDQQEDSGAR